MTVTRAQGRPRRGTAEVGRDGIISRLQVVYRSGGDLDHSRKTLAALAGVTPALITYYFPKKEVLLEAISRPVIKQYREDMEKIIFSQTASNEAKLNNLVILLMGLYSTDCGLLDTYVSLIRKTGQNGNVTRCEVTRMTTMLSDFFTGWRQRPSESGFDAAVLQGVIWGMCRFVALIDENKCREDLMPFVDHVVKLMSPPAGAFA